jgi:hypothetical protein
MPGQESQPEEILSTWALHHEQVLVSLVANNALWKGRSTELVATVAAAVPNRDVFLLVDRLLEYFRPERAIKRQRCVYRHLCVSGVEEGGPDTQTATGSPKRK